MGLARNPQRLLLPFLGLLISAVSAAAAPQKRHVDTVDKPDVIENIEIEGINAQRAEALKETFSHDLKNLVGQAVDRETIDKLAERMSDRLGPAGFLASQLRPGMRAGGVQLILVVDHCSVESVSIEGPGQSVVSAKLAAAMQNLIGKPYVFLETKVLQNQLTTELPPSYRVEGLRLDRGTSRRQVRLVFETNRGPLLRFRTPDLFSNYRSTQGQSISFPLPIWCGGDPRTPRTSTGESGEQCLAGDTTVSLLHLVHDRDDSVERDTGIAATLESVRLGTDRLGAKLTYSIYGVHWAAETSQATDARASADLYRRRQTVEPSLAVAFTDGLYATVGFRLARLTMRSPAEGSRWANAATGSLAFESGAGAVVARGHRISAISVGYDIRAGGHSTGSDFVYARHLLTARFIKPFNAAMGDRFGEVETGSLSFDAKAGRITGTAPLFDRFSIGNVDTLRGWNKFEIAPRGTNRIAHASLVYSAFPGRCKCFRGYLLYDAGAGWNEGEPIRVRHSAGMGIGVLKGFVEVAFPIMRRINSNDKSAVEMFGAPVFTLGLRHNISELLRW